MCTLVVIKNSLFGWQAKVHDLAGDDYRASVLESIKGWIKVVFSVLFRVPFVPSYIVAQS